MRSAANCALGRRAHSPARVLRSTAASDNCTTVNVALPLRASLTSCARRSQEQSVIAQLPKSLRGRERSRAVHKTPIPPTEACWVPKERASLKNTVIFGLQKAPLPYRFLDGITVVKHCRKEKSSPRSSTSSAGASRRNKSTAIVRRFHPTQHRLGPSSRAQTPAKRVRACGAILALWQTAIRAAGVG